MAKKRRAKKTNNNRKRPKGSYSLPNGNYVVTTYHTTAKGRCLEIRGVHKAEPDPKKVAEALLQLAVELSNTRADADEA